MEGDDVNKHELKLLEYKTLYNGDANDIQSFYQTHGSKLINKTGVNASKGWFWSQVASNPTDEVVRIHTGLPKLISSKMADLLLVNGYNITLDGDDNDEKEDRLNEILKANKFKVKLAQLIETASYSGGTALKISIDPLFNEPLIEVANPDCYQPVVYRNRIIGDKFIVKYYDDEDNEYELHETYGVDRDKGSYIKYKLFKVGTDNEDSKQVPLTTLEDTSNLKDIYINGLYIKLSQYIPNKLPNGILNSTVLGESDYAGVEGLFQSIDEIYSTYLQEFRDSKLNRYFPSNLLILDPDTGEYRRENALKSNHILYSTGISEEGQGTVEYKQGDLRSEKHELAFKTTLTQLLNAVGLSPLSIGVTGLESIDSSAESQRERERVSIRTRERKAEVLEEALNSFLSALLVADDILHSNDGQSAHTQEYDVNFMFNDYMIKSKEQKIAEMEVAIRTGVVDLWTAIEYIYDDLSYEDRVSILIKSKIENGHTAYTKKEQEWYDKLMSGTPILEE